MKPCSRVCSEAGEPLAGSAGNPDVWIGLSWPKPLWDPERALRSRGLPHGLEELVTHAEAEGREFSLRLFQRAPDTATERVELLALRPATGASLWQRDLPASQVATRLQNFLDDAAGGASLAAGPPQLLVCTDGRHDRCCAEYGAATYRALQREIAARDLGVQIAESSHLGGHRFASNCLVLPEARLYGRLRAEHAPGLLAAVLSKRVYAGRYRGRMGLEEPRQVAEAFALNQHRDAGQVEVGAAVADPGSGCVRVAVAVRSSRGTRELSVVCGKRRFAGASSCGAEAPAEPRTRWVVLRADEGFRGSEPA